jgi:hypothetical protein
MNKLFEIIYCLHFFVSFIIKCSWNGFFFVDSHILWLLILLCSIGIILGVFWAEKLEKEK